MNVVEVRVTPESGDEVEVSGTTIGPEPRLFLASAYGFGIDIELARDMVFFRYDDIPGVIGRVGTMFGDNGANIANMAVSRTRDGQQGVDGALGRRAAVPSADRPDAQRGLRRRHLHRAGLTPSRRAVRDRARRTWVVAQFVLMAAVLAAAFLPPDWPKARSGRSGSPVRFSRSPAVRSPSGRAGRSAAR